MPHISPYRLKVQQVDHICLFELTWGEGQQLAAQVAYPIGVVQLYQQWQRLYLTFYQNVQLTAPAVDNLAPSLRGKVVSSGNVTPSEINCRSDLVQAEANLLTSFHHWLQNADLYPIRRELARACSQLNASSPLLFLTCSPLELARLPWEAWEIGTEFATGISLQIVRTPPTIRTSAAVARPRQGRSRILAVLGDETGLNFEADRQAVRSLARIAEVQFVGWQPGKSAAAVQAEICDALIDDRGWDVLFFAGHSNETHITGGELAIAPGVTLSAQEIAEKLTIARERGLQFALFNSCSGLSIAEFLIDLGFSQVAVMREPIHNRVAQEFLIGFLNHLAQQQNVHQSLLSTCQTLKLDKNITYPSAHLVPSLFCHPGATLFQMVRPNWRQRLQQWLPQRYDAAVLVVGLTLSLLPPVQAQMLEQRVRVQAQYRHLTGQLPAVTVPPVALVLVDDASVRRDPRLTDPAPIDRRYLADLVNWLSQRGARIVGIDYLLDRQTGAEAELRQILEQAVNRRTWLVFGTLYNPFEVQQIFTPAQSGVAQSTWSMQGYVTMTPDHVTLPFPNEDCRQTCPFAYLLSLIQAANRLEQISLEQPNLQQTQDLRTAFVNQIESIAHASSDSDDLAANRLRFLQRARLHPISVFTSELLHQISLEPIIDFSIPPDRIYQAISAWRLLEDQTLKLPDLSQQVVIIGAGDYTDGGAVEQEGLDTFPVPAAVQYWRTQMPVGNGAMFSSATENSTDAPTLNYLRFYMGAEAHAYMVHHLLNQRLLIPIPTLWLIGLAAVLGKAAMLALRRLPAHHLLLRSPSLITGMIVTTTLYGLISLQLYISAAVLLPWLFPSVLFWMYFLPLFWRKQQRG